MGLGRLSGQGHGVDFPVDTEGAGILGESEVVIHLNAQPEGGGVAEVDGEPQGGVGGDASFPVDDLIDPARGNAQGSSELVLADVQWFQEFLKENFAGMRRFSWGRLFKMIFHHGEFLGM